MTKIKRLPIPRIKLYRSIVKESACPTVNHMNVLQSIQSRRFEWLIRTRYICICKWASIKGPNRASIRQSMYFCRVEMIVRSLLLVLCLSLVPVFCDESPLKLNSSISYPLHYDVKITLNVEEKSFSVEEVIQIFVLEDTEVIEINSNNLFVDWLKSRLVGPDGQEYSPISWTEEVMRNCISLLFEEAIPGDGEYSLLLTDIRGEFGSGLVEVPLSGDGDSSDGK